MTEKKKHEHDEELTRMRIEENHAEAVATSEDVEQLSAESRGAEKAT